MLNQILKIFKFPEKVRNKDILEKVKLRDFAKKEKNYELADKIRDEIEKKGFWIFDFPSGTVVVSLKKEV